MPVNKHYHCKTCGKIFYTVEMVTIHINETAIDNPDGSVEAHKIEELQGMPY